MDATEDVIKYPCCPEPFTNIIFRLIVTRKPLYLLVNLIAPNLIFSVLTVVVFTLPSEAGEKAGFAVNLILAMAVFLTSSIQLLPTSSETIPLFSYFLGLILIAMFLLTIAVCYNLSIYYMDVNVFVMPLWVREYLLNRLGRLMSVEIKRRSPGWRKALRKFDASRPIYINAQLGCYHPGRLWAMERKKRSRAAGALWERSRTEKNPMFEKEDAKDIFHRLDLVIKAFEESKDSSQRQAEWRAVSKALDKLCLWIFSVMFLFILIICALMGAY